ncbi:MAG: efflux RND transporter periplasmic adaptor subunit [Acidobacteria bacterium]|nr:efflux RND transporter periplasmic adaptor subunit [Acidobacteriota bacterium]MBI3421786.1 efflux RND transporter periplasmic adaptor subunit [Acidobacteriota bacterium]
MNNLSNETTQTRRYSPPFYHGVSACLLLACALLLAACNSKAEQPEAPAKQADKHDEHKPGAAQEVELAPAALKAAGIEFAEVTARAFSGRLRVAGSVETNQLQTQQATPLVTGRIERVYAAPGERVKAGAVLAMISSPLIAQMHGKLHESETTLALAERNLKRVEQAENRAAVLTAKARLDEAEAALNRTRKLIELGAGAGKDLIAAETAYKTAKADYDFQGNIMLNKEIQEARAAVETARVDVSHIRFEMKALGAPVAEDDHDDHTRDTSLLALRAPVSGTVTERTVNAGAGIEAGKPLFTIANLTTVWVIASVPEAQLSGLRAGTAAQIFAAAFGADSRPARISYVDPQLNEDTRTARVRLEVANPGEKLKAGMFVEVEFQTGAAINEGTEIVIPSLALQRLGERTVVFLAEAGEAGHFTVRAVEAGGASNGLTRILNGLKAGERIVTKGSFTLKAQLLKSEMEDEH